MKKKLKKKLKEKEKVFKENTKLVIIKKIKKKKKKLNLEYQKELNHFLFLNLV